MMTFRAIIFDLDGTLLNTLQDLALSVNTVLRTHKFPEHPVESYRFFIGDGIEAMVRRALPKDIGKNQAILINEMVEAVREEYHRHWSDHSLPYPGVLEMLASFKEQSIPMAVLSNKPHEFTVLMVNRLLPHRCFSAVEGARPEVPQKPDPAGALSIAKRLNLKPEEVVYLGDTNTDMWTAVAAGMYPIGALWGFRDSDELLEAGARLLVKEPRELVTLFQ
jgi:phosphoglycolate phosphatase